ncbi:LutB/LldF family L-lactate oxidation iron-sulfur protein, partial [Campylobacter jejuni]
MRENLMTAMHTLQKNRLGVIDARFRDWQGLRAKAKQAKNNALMSLKDRLLEFEKNATKNGIQVHWASSDKDACEIVYEIMREKNITKLLKGKSMASEEIGLNHYLEKKGLKAIETDLGELILQLNEEPPLHIVVPAIHRNRHEIGQIFKDKLGAKLENDEPESLNAIARDHLRKDFEGLKLGLSGVNFAMSREGAFWLIENEGNGRMCTTAPDIHIALCGVEKVMESFEDAATMVSLLTPSATGQFIPTYNNIITGPRKNGDLDGPKEVHVILFDHNRTKMLAHKDYYEALRCIRCGACMNFCPVYDQIGGHAYQTTYPGPIGEVISPNIFGIDHTGDILNFCSLCGRCSEVCPVQIPLADLIRKLRC